MPLALPTKYAVVERFICHECHGFEGKPPWELNPHPTLSNMLLVPVGWL